MDELSLPPANAEKNEDGRKKHVKVIMKYPLQTTQSWEGTSMKKATFDIWFTSAFAFIFLLGICASVEAQQVLTGHVPPAVSKLGLQPISRLDGTRQLTLAIGLPLQNQEGLNGFLQELYDPTSPNFRHYLTTDQFTAQFGPAQQDYQAVIDFATANGLTVTDTPPNRLLVVVTGTVQNIEKAFHLNMQVYHHPTETRTFYAPDRDPSLDLAVRVLRVSGLEDYSLPKPRINTNTNSKGRNLASKSTTSSIQSGYYYGREFRKIYSPGVTLDGSGQKVGLVEYGGYNASDIAYFDSIAGMPRLQLQNVLVFPNIPVPPDGNPYSTDIEVCLDIEMAQAMAPGLSKVIVYEAPGDSCYLASSWDVMLDTMANANAARQLSCSWYLPNGPADPIADQVFKQMASQGQSFFEASGDDGAYTGLIDFPGDNPYITSVGGTVVTTNPDTTWNSETTWNDGHNSISGGGISTQYALPS
jgi:subtilase family serine protease